MAVRRQWVLFSEVRGQVLWGGKAVEGAKVIERARVSENDAGNRVQEAMTDTDGKFHFPAIVKRVGLLYRVLPGQPVVSQTIVITYEGIDYEGWLHSKFTFEADTELDGRPLDFVCELTDEPVAVGTHYGICKPRGEVIQLAHEESCRESAEVSVVLPEQRDRDGGGWRTDMRVRA